MSRMFLRGSLISFFTFVLSLVAVTAYSQQQFIVRHYTNENGLPANGIKGLELDTINGFLWVGTQAGLVRFDGANFKSFSSAKSATVSRTAMLTRNRQGDIYCGDDRFSVYRIHNNQPEWVMTDTIFYPYYQSKVWQSQYQAVIQLKNKLKNLKRSDYLLNWILFHDESGDSNCVSFIQFGHAYHYCAYEDSVYDYPGFNKVMKLGKDVYYVDSALHLWRYNDRSKQPEAVSIKGMPDWKETKGEVPRYIWEPGMKEPLFLWRGNIWKVQGQGNALELSPLCFDCCPRNADISWVQIWEKRETVLLGSPVNGLYVIRPNFLRSIRADTTVNTGQAEYTQGEMTTGVVTSSSGLSFTTQGKLLHPENNTWFHPQTLYRDRHGDYWSNARDTIIHFYAAGKRFDRIAVNDGSERMIFTELGNRLFVFSDRAIGEITGKMYRPLYKLPWSASNMENWLNPDAVVELKPGLLAIATEELMLFDTVQKTNPDTLHIPGLKVKVRALYKHGDYLIIGTYGQGFYMYSNGVVKKMPLDKNGYLSYVHCFIPDAKGFCWISTNHGLFKASLQALETAFENNLPEIYYHYFGKDDGMFNTELNGGCQPCGLQLSNGLFSFPTMNGMVIVDPMKHHNPPPSGQVFIEEILADSLSYKARDSALQSLPYYTRNLRFRLSLPRFGNAENIYFSYRLEPYNDAWETQDILQNNIIQFGGLPPGSYTLYVRVRNGFEPDQFGISMIKFRIAKPWYQSLWAIVLALLIFLGLIWGIVKWRTGRIEKRRKELQHLVTVQTKNIEEQSRQLEHQLHQLKNQQEKLEEDNTIKARLIGIISHDMISPLRFMGFLAKKLRGSMPASDQGYRTVNAFVNVSEELESLSVNMLDWIRFHHGAYDLKPGQFDLHELVNESTGIAATLAKEKGIQFYNEVPKDTRVCQYRQAIGVMVYNLAMNAMKYAESGEIRIAGQPDASGYSIIVADTGIGMSPGLVDILNSREQLNVEDSTGEMKKFQFGYLIIKDLLHLVQGDMQVESKLQEGTKVTIRFALLTQ